MYPVLEVVVVVDRKKLLHILLVAALVNCCDPEYK